MELEPLFDEERYIQGEEHSRPADEEKDGWSGGDITWADSVFQRVRLFKIDATIKQNRNSGGCRQDLPLYVIVEDSCIWQGEDPRWPTTRQTKRTYVTGPGSKRIRQAAAIADSYGGAFNK